MVALICVGEVIQRVFGVLLCAVPVPVGVGGDSMKKIWNALKIGLQVIKCLRCAHLTECPFSVVSAVVRFDNKDYILTVKEKEEDE